MDLKTRNTKADSIPALHEPIGYSGLSQRPAEVWARRLSYRNVSVLYLLAVLLILFTFTTAGTFWVPGTFKSILAQEATTAVLAVGLIVPLAAGGFDLSIGYTASLSSTITAMLVVNHHWSTAAAIPVALLCCLLVGVVNGIIVVRFRIDSFIATLATGAIVGSVIVWISNARDISGLPTGFVNLSVDGFLGLTYPTWVAIIVAVVLWFVLEHTPSGRFLYATGGGIDAARLSGIRTERVLGGSFLVSALAAGIAGVIDLSRLGVASSALGGQYLLPAFAAAFLGATQFKQGRFNVWGTIISIIVLAIGAKGFDLLGLQYWVKNIFYGLALLAAVGLAASQRKHRSARWAKWRRASADKAVV